MTTFILSYMINNHDSGSIRNILATMWTWAERARMRRQLARWSERELHDIGQSWSTVFEEVNKPFWRA